MLLNIGPKADGTICDEELHVLRSMGKWLKKNGEGIYGATFWDVYGEGPTDVPSGYFTDNTPAQYTCEDFRFTYKGGALYAFAMKWPENGKAKIKTLRIESPRPNNFAIKDISVVGYDNEVTFEQDGEGLHIIVAGKIETEYPVCLKITRT